MQDNDFLISSLAPAFKPAILNTLFQTAAYRQFRDALKEDLRKRTDKLELLNEIYHQVQNRCLMVRGVPKLLVYICQVKCLSKRTNTILEHPVECES